MSIEKEIVRAILRSAYIRECAERVIKEYDSGVLTGKPGFEGQASLSISCLRDALKGFIPKSLPEEFIAGNNYSVVCKTEAVAGDHSFVEATDEFNS